ncbi:ribose-phosphate diphosphokinase [Halomonas sp. MCCC 1A17488]|uniref:Ribose-phosphate diphosphokinase n=1 Tax=Billgrantia sulfidoxydans TaxID=2733484 RepID=A0ABX7W9N2_9GAMM|nr:MULTISPECIES: ribose-phosphate diphosphokinase [Halomonas]MCE8014489.1 ribose-phosphate diphosphokinase [Halomonas sp. MCCC 1A17488]MCG3237822.1 ribose-phosphate diphosphokinase [Halomonas sp. MCCC 1A17488]QPP48384.1 ribose-phosphate diphosphokinase [Halomonas sp. SS10-MC5]QTP55694.1 ribose-phosphate diphosphokinase [Halomonas sulfidoxydans]
MRAALLYFEEESLPAGRLAAAAGIEARAVGRHRFPDEELCLRLPDVELPACLVIYRSLDRPNDKLVELMLLARHARAQGVKRLVLVAPYLAYMRQDMAFHPGELVSQRLVGGFLAESFDAVVTVDPHLHRIERLEQAIPLAHALALSGAPQLGAAIVQRRPDALLLGPDAESLQWVESAARVAGLDYGVCTKARHGDRDVDIALPDLAIAGRRVVLLDDVASSGRTLAQAAEQVLAAGADSVDVAVTHALFAGDAMSVIRRAGVGEVWSTDTIVHESNAVHMASVLARALARLIDEG